MGMTPEQYWDESPYLAVAYRKAYYLKRKAENENDWLLGFYVYGAVAIALANAFKRQGQKAQNYLEKPVDIFPLTPMEKKQRERDEREKMKRAMEEMIRKQRHDKQSKGD